MADELDGLLSHPKYIVEQKGTDESVFDEG